MPSLLWRKTLISIGEVQISMQEDIGKTGEDTNGVNSVLLLLLNAHTKNINYLSQNLKQQPCELCSSDRFLYELKRCYISRTTLISNRH